jgi:hypothetical protein
MSLNRTLAGLITTTGDVKSASLDNAASLTVYATKEDLPSSGMSSGDQAYVTGNSRFYISNGSGWYNVALVNATPSLSIDPTGAIALSTTGETTTITLTATDSDNAVAGLTYSVESDGSFAGLGTISQDSSVFTITPLSEDSATTASAVLTFKASDGISFGTGTTTFTLTFKALYSNYTTTLLKADTTGTDNQVDTSTNNHTITENGNVTSTAFTPYHPGGYSTYFDGSGGDYIKTDTHADFAFQDGDFTIECWYYPVSKAQNYPRILHFGTYWSGSDAWGLLDRHNSNNTKFWVSSFSGINILSTTTVENNKWYHLAIERSGTTITLYVNGTAEGTASVGTNNYPDASATSYLNIGNVSNGSNLNEAAANGYVRDVRIVKGSAVYTSDFTPPTAPLTVVTNTKFLFDALVTKDISGEGHTPDRYGSVTSQRFGPYDYLSYAKADYGGSVYFDGTGDYLSGNDMGLGGAGVFTVEAWIYPTVLNTYANDIYSQGANLSVGADFLSFGLNSGGNVQMFKGSGTPALLSTSAPCATLNQWYHVAFVRESNNNTSAYVNGVLVAGPIVLTGALASAPSGRAFIGTQSYSAGASDRSFEGYIQDVRIVNGTAVYTSNFTPPTTPLTAITNTQLLTCTNKNDIWDAASGTLLTKVGNATSSNTQRQFTTSSAMYFDGTGDYLNTNSNNLLALGTGDFTVECWVNKSDTNHRGIFQISPTSGGLDTNYTVTLGFAWGNLNAWQIYAGGGATNGSTFSLSTDTWYHAALVRSSGTTKLYIDGTEEISISDSQNYAGTYMAIGGYYNTTYLHNGYIQDLRITKGLARYTSAFTPPTAEFDG